MLRTHGLLARQLGGDVHDGPAFREGVAEGAQRDLAAGLFATRAAGLLGMRDDADAAAHANDLLIGADVSARLHETPCGVVHVLADRVLGAVYAAAVEVLGGSAILVDSQAGFVNGIIQTGRFAP